MSTWLFDHEPVLRLALSAGIFIMIAFAELLWPRRSLHAGRWLRWPGNVGIVLLNTLLLRLLFPTAAVGIALFAAHKGWGLLNVVALPSWLAVTLSVLALDLSIYFQHIVLHAVPYLWRLHRMHHADLDFDVTTGLRFHPLEILLSMAFKCIVVVALGAPPVAVIVFEVLLNATSLFNHANLRLAKAQDRVLRWLVVTPDMHRVHHSIRREETDSNFGFNLPWWDWLFGTYRAQPAAGHDGMTIGIPLFRDSGELRLDRMLFQPFRRT